MGVPRAYLPNTAQVNCDPNDDQPIQAGFARVWRLTLMHMLAVCMLGARARMHRYLIVPWRVERRVIGKYKRRPHTPEHTHRLKQLVSRVGPKSDDSPNHAQPHRVILLG